MAHSGRLRRKADGRLVAALASGLSVRSAAKRAGLSERSAFRRQADPTFRQEVDDARREIISRATGKLAGASIRAAATLVKLLGDGNSSVKRLAAVNILELRLKIGQVEEMERRITALESLYHGRQTNGT